jgi:hypothetical protein
MDKPLAMEVIDSGSGVLFPFWDDGTSMVYLVGKVGMAGLCQAILCVIVLRYRETQMFGFSR